MAGGGGAKDVFPCMCGVGWLGWAGVVFAKIFVLCADGVHVSMCPSGCCACVRNREIERGIYGGPRTDIKCFIIYYLLLFNLNNPYTLFLNI